MVQPIASATGVTTDVASGRTKPWSDRWGIHNDLTLFNPAPVT